MIDVKTARVLTISGLDNVAKSLLGAKVIGCSCGPRGSTVHLTDNATQADINAITNLLTVSETLVVTGDKSAIVANGVDTATVSYLTNVGVVDYLVFVNGVAYASGTDTGDGSVVTLTSLVSGSQRMMPWTGLVVRSSWLRRSRRAVA